VVWSVRVTSQASYSPEYITPTQKNHDYSTLLTFLAMKALVASLEIIFWDLPVKMISTNACVPVTKKTYLSVKNIGYKYAVLSYICSMVFRNLQLLQSSFC
jgi:hypothetical protein